MLFEWFFNDKLSVTLVMVFYVINNVKFSFKLSHPELLLFLLTTVLDGFISLIMGKGVFALFTDLLL